MYIKSNRNVPTSRTSYECARLRLRLSAETHTHTRARAFLLLLLLPSAHLLYFKKRGEGVNTIFSSLKKSRFYCSGLWVRHHSSFPQPYGGLTSHHRTTSGSPVIARFDLVLVSQKGVKKKGETPKRNTNKRKAGRRRRETIRMTTLTTTTKKKTYRQCVSRSWGRSFKKTGASRAFLLPVVVSLASSKRREVPSFLRLQNVVVVVKRMLFFLPQSAERRRLLKMCKQSRVDLNRLADFFFFLCEIGRLDMIPQIYR